MNDRKVWLVKHPTHQYNEDVKALARQNNLRIIDASTGVEFDKDSLADKPPKLTKKADKKAAE